MGKVLWYLVINTKGGGERGGITSGVKTPVLTPHFKRRGRGVFGAYTVVLLANMVIFGEITGVFEANMVVFGGKYCGIWSLIQRGEEKGGIISGVRTPVLTPHLKRRGRGVFGAYTVVLLANMVIFGAIIVGLGANMVVFGGKYCGIGS